MADLVQSLTSIAVTLDELNRAQRDFGRAVFLWRLAAARWQVADAVVVLSPYLAR